MNRIKRLLNRKDIKLISQKDDTTIKSFNDLYQKSINEIENQIKEGLKKILEKAGFKDLDTIKNCIIRDQIIISYDIYPEYGPQRIYRVYISKKLFAEMQVDFNTSLEKHVIQITYKITYFD